MAVALADKLDLLISFFSIDEKPTGSRDPYALRRAALGVIRIILASKAKLPLKALLRFAADAGDGSPADQDRREAATSAVLMFLGERLKVMLRDEGKRHDLVDAVFALAGDDLVAVTTRVDALSDFLDTPDGLSLLAGYRRAVNILKAEDRKGRDAAPDPGGAPSPPAEEAALDAAVQAFAVEGRRALAGEDVLSALQALSRLRAPVDAFFDKVLVNDEDERVRFRRLQLLTQVRDEANRIADFSLVSG
jgi:glycyl-tRNA synthetase beta chain